MNSRRAGLSLVEVLVVVSIVGMLAAIAIPAVNAAREVGRRNTCTNNFKQFGTGLISYEAAKGYFASFAEPASTPHTAVLPYLGFNDVYQSLGMQRFKGHIITGQGAAAAGVGIDRIPVFRCPSDPQEITDADDWPGNNIRACRGIYDFHPYPPGVNEKVWNGRSGVFSSWDVRSRDMLDGASRTIAASEKLLGSGPGAGYDPRRDYFHTGLLFLNPPQPPDMDLLISACESAAASGSPFYYSGSGLTWVVHGFDCTFYNHALGPNSRIPDCTSADTASITFPSLSTILAGIHTATSNHPGGVNVLFLDGHVEFVINDVDLAIWRAFATRAAGD